MRRRLPIEQQSEPFGMLQRLGPRVGPPDPGRPSPCRAGRGWRAGRAWDGPAWWFSSMEVAGAAQVGLIDDHCGLVWSGPAAQPVGQDGSDALVGQRADLESTGQHSLGAASLKVAEQAQDAEAGPGDPISSSSSECLSRPRRRRGLRSALPDHPPRVVTRRHAEGDCPVHLRKARLNAAGSEKPSRCAVCFKENSWELT